MFCLPTFPGEHHVRAFALVFTALLAGAGSLDAQVATARATAVASVSGTVVDSLGRKPLRGAIVQIASADPASSLTRSANADSLGRFRIDSLPGGRYMAGFFHPILDSLGIEPPLREVIVYDVGTTRADLAIPSAESFRNTICGPRTSARGEETAMVFGIVRKARDRAPAADAIVFAQWREYSFSRDGVVSRMPFVSTKAASNGWYAFCKLPGKGSILLFAASGADSTERLEFEMSDDRFLRRDVYVGNASASEGSGTSRLTGVIVAADSATPIANAEIVIGGTRKTRANARGEFTIPDAPTGTRMMDIRAVGFYPERRVVDVIDSAAPIRVQLPTLKSVLATVRVTAPRTLMSNLKDFEFRRKTGIGRFITAADLAKSQPVVTSDIFRFIPGITLYTDRDSSITRVVFRRGAFDSPCSPDLFVDGRPLGVVTAIELDGAATPADIKAIEIYVGSNTPPMFSAGTLGNACGSIVIWTKFG